MKKLVIMIGVVCILVFVAVFGYFRIAYETIDITVSGSHNPVANILFVNGKQSYPRGEGGNNYRERVKKGVVTLLYGGPFVSKIEKKVDSSTANHLLEASPSNPSSVLVQGGVEEFVFGRRDDWLVIRGTERNESVVYIFNFSYASLEWTPVLSGSKLDFGDQKISKAPLELKEKIRGLAGD